MSETLRGNGEKKNNYKVQGFNFFRNGITTGDKRFRRLISRREIRKKSVGVRAWALCRDDQSDTRPGGGGSGLAKRCENWQRRFLYNAKISTYRWTRTTAGMVSNRFPLPRDPTRNNLSTTVSHASPMIAVLRTRSDNSDRITIVFGLAVFAPRYPPGPIV